MRDLEGIAKLIDFIGRPEWSDLHVFAVIVLSNCLEDRECMEVCEGGVRLTVLIIQNLHNSRDS